MAARIPVHALEHPSWLVPEAAVWQLMENVARDDGFEDIGLAAGAAGRLSDIGRLGERIESAYTLHDALQTFIESIGGHSSLCAYWLEFRRDDVLFCRTGTEGLKSGSWPAEQYVISLMIQIVRLAAGSHWCPREVYLHSARTSGVERFDALSLADIRTSASCTAIAISLDHLGSRMRSQAAPSTEDSGRMPITVDFVQSLRAAVRSYLPEGYPGILLAAEIAGTSVRTLQRQLLEAHTSYSRLVDHVRHEAALETLAQSNARVIDVAYDLGYADPASFTRAFRRWAGVSPSAFRARHGFGGM